MSAGMLVAGAPRKSQTSDETRRCPCLRLKRSAEFEVCVFGKSTAAAIFCCRPVSSGRGRGRVSSSCCLSQIVRSPEPKVKTIVPGCGTASCRDEICGKGLSAKPKLVRFRPQGSMLVVAAAMVAGKYPYSKSASGRKVECDAG